MHDIHIHTKLSICADSNATYQAYSSVIAERKLAVVGFSDHIWDHAIPGWIDWYSPMDVPHVMSLRDEIERNPLKNTQVYFGCETEYTGKGKVGLHSDSSKLFDYVLVPPHHFHIPEVRNPQITELDKLVKLFIERFMEVCDIKFAFGIAHPFVPLGLAGREAEVMKALPEKSLRECFTAARESNKSIEINVACVKSMHIAGVLEFYKNIICIAADCSCKFHLGSDAHTMSDLAQENYDLAVEFVKQCAITLPEDPLKEYVSNNL